jgi:ribosome-associated toxin RatA of RatAB toxin-antitoxin module
MNSNISIEIAAPPELVFRLARDIERWPRLLPHYVSVSVLSRRPDGRTTVRMIARRPLLGLVGFGLPVVWRARTWAEPANLRLRFQHLGGVTAGMDVTWRIEPTGGGCHVAIEHVFRRRLPIPVLGKLLGDEVLPAFVDRFFTRPIAQRTLATFATLAEATAQAVARVDTSDQRPDAYPIA